MDKEDFDKMIDEDMFIYEMEQEQKESGGGPNNSGGCFSGCLYIFIVGIIILIVIGVIYASIASSCAG